MSAAGSSAIHLRSPLAAAGALAAGGVDVVSVANNHALDFGAEAFTDELSRLDAVGVAYAGGGEDAAAAHRPIVVEENGLAVAFLGYVLPFSSNTSFHTRDWQAGPSRPGLAIGTPEAVQADVAAARLVADVVVVMVHGGLEYRRRPMNKQLNFAAAALGAGASLVLGHHPHVLQGYMHQDGKLAAFSLGNFVFARFDGASNDSAILDVTLDAGGVASLSWLPVAIVRGIPRPATGDDAARILARLPEL
jgi:poly-gamma-glutamate synthesis protein (capsule biosynthesis protein)